MFCVKGLRHRCFPVNFDKFLRISFFNKTPPDECSLAGSFQRQSKSGRMSFYYIGHKLLMHNAPKWSGTLQKSCSIWCKILKVCQTILGRYYIKRLRNNQAHNQCYHYIYGSILLKKLFFKISQYSLVNT